MAPSLTVAPRVLWMPLDHAWQPASESAHHCCAVMAHSLVHTCEQHSDPFDCPDVALVYHEIFGEYGIPVRDGGASYLVIAHCPWCGTGLPASGREAWFDALESAGLAETPFDELPAEFRTAAWRTKAQ